MNKDPISTTADAMERAAIETRAKVAHCAPPPNGTAEQAPLPPEMAARAPSEKSPAEWAYERLILYVRKFEEQLDADHEIGMGFAGSGTGTVHIQGIGFFAPDFVTFYGMDDGGTKTQLVQHVTQINVALKAVPKRQETPSRFGFALAEAIDGT